MMEAAKRKEEEKKQEQGGSDKKHEEQLQVESLNYEVRGVGPRQQAGGDVQRVEQLRNSQALHERALQYWH